MTIKSFESIDKKGRQTTWEWDETPEVVVALEKLQATERLHEDMRQSKNKG